MLNKSHVFIFRLISTNKQKNKMRETINYKYADLRTAGPKRRLAACHINVSQKTE